MTFRVVLQPRAERDLWAAARWIEDQSRSPGKALRWVRGIRAKIDTLKANPSVVRSIPIPTAYGEEVRMLLYGKRHGKYRILFAIRADAVQVLTVRHSARKSLGEEMVPVDTAEGDDPIH